MYCEVVTKLSERGRIEDEANIPKLTDEALAKGEEMYVSYYRFDEEILEHLRIKSSIKGYIGKLYLPEITLDIDRGTDTHEETHERMLKLRKKLLDEHWVQDESEITTWFSGRGYHVVIPNAFFPPGYKLNEQVKMVLEHYFPECDSIYDATRIIRAPHTINIKSGLHKIYVNGEAPADVLASAAIPLRRDPPSKPGVVSQKLRTDISTPLIPLSLTDMRIDRGDDASRTVVCMQKVYAEGGNKGARHTNGLRLISAWRRAGLPAAAAIEALKSWAPTLDPYEIKRMVTKGYENKYAYSCHDKVMMQYCDSKCIYFRLKNYTPPIRTAAEAEMELEANLESMKTPICDLKSLFPHISYPFHAGEFVLVFADTKMGKSSLMMSAAVAWPDVEILYMPFEMGTPLTYRRLVQIAHGMSKEGVYEALGTGKRTFTGMLEHIKLMDVPVTIRELRRIIGETRAKVVILDVIDELDHANNLEANAKLGEIALELKTMAKNQGVCIIGIHHTSKDGTAVVDYKTGYKKPLDIHSGKGPSALEQKADKVIGIEGDREGTKRLVRSLGTRDEADFRVSALFNKSSMRFVEDTASYTKPEEEP